MSPTATPLPRPDPVDEALAELLQIGMMAARAVGAAVATAHYAPDTAQVAALERVGRFVRRTALLIRKFAEPASPARTAHQARRRTEARARIIREVEDAIDRHEGPERPETLHAELAERLEAPDLDDEIATRPVADIIQDVQRDLGLNPTPGGHSGTPHSWPRRRPAQVRDLRRRAAQPAGPPPARPATDRASPAPDNRQPATAHPPPDD